MSDCVLLLAYNCLHECGSAISGKCNAIATNKAISDHTYLSRIGVQAIDLIWHHRHRAEVVQETIAVRMQSVYVHYDYNSKGNVRRAGEEYRAADRVYFDVVQAVELAPEEVVEKHGRVVR